MKQLDRRDFIKTSLLTTAVPITRLQSAFPNRKKRPNILLYVVDDHGTDDAGCYGNKVIKTPGLDYLAGEGVRFTHAFCTTASCSPSRSVILSGRYSHANGMFGLAHAIHHFQSFDNFKSLPALLSEAGYTTICAGKYHVAPEPVYHFHQYIGTQAPELMADACRSIIKENTNHPFFLYFCTTEPHRPFLREGSESINPDDVIVPCYLPDIPECREELAQYYMSVERADKGLSRLVDILKESDQWQDTLIIYISDNGIAFPGAKTTVHEPGLRLPCVVRNPYANTKGVVNDAMINWADITPTILDFAGILPDRYNISRINIPKELKFNDKIPQNHFFHGRSFLPILTQEHPQGWDEIYASHTFHEVYMYYPMRVVRERKYKLIWNIAYKLDFPFAADLYASRTWQAILKNKKNNYGKRRVDAYIHHPEFELYDLENDPDEVNNLADNPEYSGELNRLQQKLKEFQYTTEDRWLNKWKYE